MRSRPLMVGLAGLAGVAVVGVGLAFLVSLEDEPPVPGRGPIKGLKVSQQHVLEFVGKYHPLAVKVRDQYRIPVLVSLAQSALETGWGTSMPNNMAFGIKADRSWKGPDAVVMTHEYDNEKAEPGKFRSYETVEASWLNYGAFLNENRRYRPAFQHTGNPERFAREVARAGYGTGPKYESALVATMGTVSRALKQLGLSDGSSPAPAPSAKSVAKASSPTLAPVAKQASSPSPAPVAKQASSPSPAPVAKQASSPSPAPDPRVFNELDDQYARIVTVQQARDWNQRLLQTPHINLAAMSKELWDIEYGLRTRPGDEHLNRSQAGWKWQTDARRHLRAAFSPVEEKRS